MALGSFLVKLCTRVIRAPLSLSGVLFYLVADGVGVVVVESIGEKSKQLGRVGLVSGHKITPVCRRVGKPRHSAAQTLRVAGAALSLIILAFWPSTNWSE